MGSGASSDGARKMTRITSEPGSKAQPDLPSSISVEEGMHWLKGMLEKEKAEKEWLAAKYDDQCQEVKRLRDEVSSLRADLVRQRGVVQSPSAAEADRSLLSPKESCSPKLQQRRGLKLNIDTPEQRPGGMASPSVVKLQSNPATQQSSESAKSGSRPSSGQVTLPAVPGASRMGTVPEDSSRPTSPDTTVTPAAKDLRQRGPSIATGTVVSADDEPMSALLRRRKEDWSVSAAQPEKPQKPETDTTDEVKPLAVTATKVACVDEPSSPKRTKPSRNAMSMRSSASLKLELVKNPDASPLSASDPFAVKNGGD